jgi:hypothetical protein
MKEALPYHKTKGVPRWRYKILVSVESNFETVSTAEQPASPITVFEVMYHLKSPFESFLFKLSWV